MLKPNFTLRLFECPSCSGLFLSGESWLGRFTKRHIPVVIGAEGVAG